MNAALERYNMPVFTIKYMIYIKSLSITSINLLGWFKQERYPRDRKQSNCAVGYLFNRACLPFV